MARRQPLTIRTITRVVMEAVQPSPDRLRVAEVVRSVLPLGLPGSGSSMAVAVLCGRHPAQREQLRLRHWAQPVVAPGGPLLPRMRPAPAVMVRVLSLFRELRMVAQSPLMEARDMRPSRTVISLVAVVLVAVLASTRQQMVVTAVMAAFPAVVEPVVAVAPTVSTCTPGPVATEHGALPSSLRTEEDVHNAY